MSGSTFLPFGCSRTFIWTRTGLECSMNEREKGDNDHRDFSYLHLIETAAAFAVSVNYK